MCHNLNGRQLIVQLCSVNIGSDECHLEGARLAAISACGLCLQKTGFLWPTLALHTSALAETEAPCTSNMFRESASLARAQRTLQCKQGSGQGRCHTP